MSVARPSYVLIVGHGRSGTNWLLDLLDLSERTHCRNEPEGARGGAMSRLPGAHFEGEADTRLEAEWDAAVALASRRFGERDHAGGSRKSYLHEFSRTLGLARLSTDPRFRARLGRLLPLLRAGEWRLSRVAGSEARLSEALPVLKLAGDPGWASWVLRRRPQTLVLHIVRHPGGFLNSWRNRYLAKQDPSKVAAANVERLRHLVELSPSWASVIGPIETMSAEESELWYWRYAMEVIRSAGRGAGGYHLVVYERLAADTANVIRSVYERCGLTWTDGVQRGFEAMSGESGSIADAWHEKLSPEHRALVDEVLEGSDLRPLWDAPR